jgi:hypothetical protein
MNQLSDVCLGAQSLGFDLTFVTQRNERPISKSVAVSFDAKVNPSMDTILAGISSTKKEGDTQTEGNTLFFSDESGQNKGISVQTYWFPIYNFNARTD